MPKRLLALVLLALAGCGDDPPVVPPGGGLAMARLSGDAQSARVGQPLPAPLRVLVTDDEGSPVSGVIVGWTVVSGSATLGASTSISGDSGIASVTVTPSAEGTILVRASAEDVAGSPVSFTATAHNGIVLVSAISFSGGYHDQFIRDGIAFLSAWSNGLRIYDIGGGGRGGSPALPVLIGSIVTATNGVSGGAQVHNAWWYHAPDGQKRYVFVGQEGPGSVPISSSGDIHVVDVSNMAAPVEVAFYHMDGLGAPRDSAGTHNFWVDETSEILYAAYYNGGIVALDISGTLSGDLSNREIARIRPGGAGNTFTWGVQLAGTSLYATDMVSGLWQLSLSGNTFQVSAGGNNVPDNWTSDLWIHGGYAYTGTWGTRNGHPGNALFIWRLDAGGAPVPADTIVTPGVATISDVEVSADGKLLMFSAENGPGAGIYFYDLTVSRSSPAFIARYATSSAGVHTATFAEVGGRRYVVAARNSPLAAIILDVTAIGP